MVLQALAGRKTLGGSIEALFRQKQWQQPISGSEETCRSKRRVRRWTRDSEVQPS